MLSTVTILRVWCNSKTHVLSTDIKRSERSRCMIDLIVLIERKIGPIITGSDFGRLKLAASMSSQALSL